MKILLARLVKHPLGALYGTLLGLVAFFAAVPAFSSGMWDAALVDLVMAGILIFLMLKSFISTFRKKSSVVEKATAWGMVVCANILALLPSHDFPGSLSTAFAFSLLICALVLYFSGRLMAVICIALKKMYFFQTNNMLMYELLVSAVPSLVLSLQPNTDRVKGKFIPYVLSRAIPGALTMTIGIMAVYLIHASSLAETFGFVQHMETPSYNALMMIALTACGLVMLYRICQPFNTVRAVLWVIAVGMCAIVLAVPTLGNFVFNGWDALTFSVPQILLMIIIVQASYPISGFLIKAFDMLTPAEPSQEEQLKRANLK